MTPAVRIDAIAAGGDGVGRLPDGRAVFIPRTAPGDLVEPRDVRLHGRWARARIGRLIEPALARVEPRCAHYTGDACGGCQLQHLTLAAQREARRRIAGDALRRIGGLEVEDPDLVPSPWEWGYRSRVTLAVSAGNRRLGFHPLERPRGVFSLRRCEIADDRLNALLPAFRDARDALPPALTGVTLRIGRAGDTHVVLRGPVRPSPESVGRVVAACRRHAGEAVLWWHPRPGVTRLLAGSPPGTPAGSFEQVHPAMGDRVRRYAVERLGAIAGRTVWDLFAGVGEATALLAERGAQVESVEVDREAVAAAERLAPGPGIRRHAGRVEEWVASLAFPPPDAVLVNPPRTGLGRGVAAALRAAAPERIVYVSCDPATLARDLAALVRPDPARSATYRLAAVHAFDLFPQTAHVEAVACLERR